MNREEALRLLGLKEVTSLDQLKAAYVKRGELLKAKMAEVAEEKQKLAIKEMAGKLQVAFKTLAAPLMQGGQGQAQAQTQAQSSSQTDTASDSSAASAPAQQSEAGSGATPPPPDNQTPPPSQDKPSRKKLFIGIGVVILLLAVAGGGLFMSGFDMSTLFEDEAVIQQRIAKVQKLYDEVKSFDSRIADKKTAYEERIRELDIKIKALTGRDEEEVKKVKETRQEQQRFATESAKYVFDTKDLQSLRAQKTQVDVLVQDEDYKQVLPLLEKLHPVYAALAAKLDAVEPMILAREESIYKQQLWEQFLTDIEMELTDELTLKGRLKQTAGLESQGNVVTAAKAYQSLVKDLSELMEGSSELPIMAQVKSYHQAWKEKRRRELLAAQPEVADIPVGILPARTDDGIKKIRLKKFGLSTHEITFAQYDVFTHQTKRPQVSDEGWGRGERPVINVSWEEATAFAKWLSDGSGKHYRLPTEAEWEYAARGSTNNLFSWGNEIGKNNANCMNCKSEWDNNLTAPVKQFAPSEYGVYDMHGNVYEWTQDCWKEGESYLGSQEEACTYRVIRGGSFMDEPANMRSDWREFAVGKNPKKNIGFRLVLDYYD